MIRAIPGPPPPPHDIPFPAAATPTAPAEESPPEPQYTEIVHRSPPEGNDQVRSSRAVLCSGVPNTLGSPSHWGWKGHKHLDSALGPTSP